jgi:acetoacetate decarboxylase
MYGDYQTYPGAGVNPPHAPAFPLEWYCPEVRSLQVVAEVDSHVVKKILSYTPFDYVSNRAKFSINYEKGHTLTTPEGYYEANVMVAARYKNYLSYHTIYIYCTDATAILGGREVWGYPKKDADVHLWEDGDHKWGKVVREGVTLFEMDFRADPGAPEAPLAEGKELYGQLNVRRLPLVDRPGEAYGDITFRAGKSTLKEKLLGHATLNLGELKWDPIYELKPKVLGATFMAFDFGGHFRDETRKILDSWTNR